MRPAKQVKVITSQLEILQDLSVQLDGHLAYINNVIQKGTSWLEETDGQTFLDITKFLTNETSECISKCLIIANGNEELQQLDSLKEQDIKGTKNLSLTDCSVDTLTSTCFSLRDDIEYQKLIERIDKIEKSISSQSKTLKTLKQKCTDNELQTTEAFSKQKEETKTDLKFEEIHQELHAASDFMLHLQTQNDTLSKEINEKTKQLNNIEQKLNNIEKQTLVTSSDLHSVDKVKFDDINIQLLENVGFMKVIKTQSESLTSKVEEMEKRFNEMPSLVDPLKTSIEDHAKKTEELKKKVTDLDRKVERLSFQVEDFEQKVSEIDSTDLAIGFDVCICDGLLVDLNEDEILTCFTAVLEDKQHNYDIETGIFTAPIDGLYMCGLFIEISSFVKHDMRFNVCLRKYNDDGDDEEIVIASCHTKYRGSTVCDVSVRSLESNDDLYVKYTSDDDNIQFNANSHSMCFLLNKY